MKAGVDVGISHEDGYVGLLLESVGEGFVLEATVDCSVRRVLEQKLRRGLFENPFVDSSQAEGSAESPSDRMLALEASRQGIVLLRNENDLLPLRRNLDSIAVIGPNAHHVRNQLGDYTSEVVLQDVVTVLEGITSMVSPSTEVHYVRGCDVIDRSWNEIPQAVDVASKSDVAVLVVGENEWQAEGRQGTSGEGYDVASLELTGLQQDLVERVVATGTPTVGILINGRPLSIRWIAENVPAILEAWSCGEEAYWIEHGWGKPYADMSPHPLFEFGFGLSYTSFEYTNLRIDPPVLGVGDQVRVSLDVQNTGQRAGAEVVQLYLQDVIASVSTPVKELKGFSRLKLGAGEKKSVSFEISPNELALLNRDLDRVVEPGEFKVMVGHSSQDSRVEGSFEVQ